MSRFSQSSAKEFSSFSFLSKFCYNLKCANISTCKLYSYVDDLTMTQFWGGTSCWAEIVVQTVSWWTSFKGCMSFLHKYNIVCIYLLWYMFRAFKRSSFWLTNHRQNFHHFNFGQSHFDFGFSAVFDWYNTKGTAKICFDCR